MPGLVAALGRRPERIFSGLLFAGTVELRAISSREMPLPPRPTDPPARFVAIGLRSLLEALRIFTGLALTAAAEAPFRSRSVCLRSLSRREGEPAPRCMTPKEPLLAAGLFEVAQIGACLARAALFSWNLSTGGPKAFNPIPDSQNPVPPQTCNPQTRVRV